MNSMHLIIDQILISLSNRRLRMGKDIYWFATFNDLSFIHQENPGLALGITISRMISSKLIPKDSAAKISSFSIGLIFSL